MISNSQVKCPCCSDKLFHACCGPYLEGSLLPKMPEALMRSRYTAYTMANIAYIEKTMRGRAAMGFDSLSATRWAKRVQWIQLEVRDTSLEIPDKGYVEFVATFIDEGRLITLHEKSEFKRDSGQWYYVSGVQFPR